MPAGVDELLRRLDPVLEPVRYAYVDVAAPGRAAGAPGTASLDEVLATGTWFALVREEEGTAAVVDEAAAARLGLGVRFLAAMITLRVHSALDAVGLTAAVAGPLAAAGISCNVVAGAHHDHLLVPPDRGAEALEILRRLTTAPA